MLIDQVENDLQVELDPDPGRLAQPGVADHGDVRRRNLLQRAKESSPEELTNRVLLFVLWYLDISLILILTFILVRNLTRLALDMSDAAIIGSQEINKSVQKYIKTIKKPVLEYKAEDEYIEAYSDFYDEILMNKMDED